MGAVLRVTRTFEPDWENVWDYLRQNKFCALVRDSYDAIVDACRTACNWLVA